MLIFPTKCIKLQTYTYLYIDKPATTVLISNSRMMFWKRHICIDNDTRHLERHRILEIRYRARGCVRYSVIIRVDFVSLYLHTHLYLKTAGGTLFRGKQINPLTTPSLSSLTKFICRSSLSIFHRNNLTSLSPFSFYCCVCITREKSTFRRGVCASARDDLMMKHNLVGQVTLSLIYLTWRAVLEKWVDYPSRTNQRRLIAWTYVKNTLLYT